MRPAAPRVASVSPRSERPRRRATLRTRAPAYRLRGARAFEAVFRTGARFDGRFLQLVAAPAAASVGRVGYIIARRSLPLAVDRNRLRRRLREAARAARPGLTAYDVIFRVRGPVARSEIANAAAEGAALIARLLASAPLSQGAS